VIKKAIQPVLPDEPKDEKPPAKSDDWFAFLVVMLALLSLPAMLLVINWVEHWGDSEDVSSQPIGALQRLTVQRGFGASLVIETELGFYPLSGSASITKGTPLVLELRGSGKRYVCDTSRSLCLETTARHFGSASQGAQP
jgi:hypothetical protein